MDHDLRFIINRVKQDFATVGTILRKMSAKAMHVALGYKNFEDYVETLGLRKTQAFESMRLVRELTEGDKPVTTAKELGQMTRENAKSIVKMKQSGVRITDKIIEAAKTLPEKKFQEQIEAPALEKKGGGKSGAATAGVVMERYVLYLPKAMMKQLMYAKDIMLHIATQKHGDGTREEQAWDMMAAEIVATHGSEYEEWLEQQEENDKRTASAAASD